MLDVLSFLFSLATAINAIIDKIKLSEQRKLVGSIHSFHLSLQAIVNNAERIFTLIENANEQINELGEAKFTKIVQENFRNQLSRLEMLAFAFHNPEMSTILDKLDTDLKRQAESMLYRKSR